METTLTETVTLPGRSYPILIGEGLLNTAASHIAHLCAGSGKAAILSDETVWALHGQALSAAMATENVSFAPIVLPPGEGSKSLATLGEVYARLAGAQISRQDVIIAFGGGVVGDLAGFAAATWMRGVRSVQLPTTLLAQVDSSVGGKTAINLPQGKNLAGAFHQPALVVADTGLLATLPQREWNSGLAEMLKYGALFSRELFEALSQPLNQAALPGLIQQCCHLKALTVQADEKDTGQRMLLNFGHTFGHAVEALGNFSRHNHGEAVAVGMALAAAYGEHLGITAPGCHRRITTALHAHGIDSHCPYPAKALPGTMALDKKGREGGIDLILLQDIGKAGTVWQSFGDIALRLREVL